MAEAEPGDWVTVYGQVVEGNVHPEDVLVEFFSHSDQYKAHVRADRVTKVEPPEGVADRCHDLWQVPVQNLMIRCTKHLRHGAMHMAIYGPDDIWWTDKESVGYMEDR